MKDIPSIALGTWAWGVGMVGGDKVFGNHLDADCLKSVFDTACDKGLTMWDSAL